MRDFWAFAELFFVISQGKNAFVQVSSVEVHVGLLSLITHL